MKIGIVGNYGNNNQGDEAILEGILIQLEAVYNIERCDILVFTNSTEQTKKKFGVKVKKLYFKKGTAPTTLIATVLKHRSFIRDLDLLLIGGGGILMDLYTHSLFLFGMYGKIAQFTKTPYVIFGAGAGPIETTKGRVILKSLVNRAEIVTVRDQASKKVLNGIGVGRDISVIADPAFYLPPPVQRKKDESVVQIGVTAVPYYHANYWPSEDKEKYESYVSGMARNLEMLLQQNPNMRINFFATKHPQDTAVSKDIMEKISCKQQCVVINRRLTQQEILELIGQQDIIIGTRLHSLILALVAKTPVIAIAYHHKVSDFMQDNNSDDYLLTMEQIKENDELFKQIYENMIQDWENTLHRFKLIAEHKTRDMPQGMDLIKEQFPQL